jgi:hypothetical protein
MRIFIRPTALLGTGPVAAKQPTRTARFIDEARVPDHSLGAAQLEAIDAVRTAGVMLQWVDSPPNFLFTIKDCKLGPRKAAPGQALVGDPQRSTYSFVYFNRVLIPRRKTELAPGHLLCDAIAHKVGHLLGLSDRRERIMTWKRGDQEFRLLARRRIGFTDAGHGGDPRQRRNNQWWSDRNGLQPYTGFKVESE